MKPKRARRHKPYNVKPTLSRAQGEALELIKKSDTLWLNPRDIRYALKSPWIALQILERKGYLEAKVIDGTICYRLNSSMPTR